MRDLELFSILADDGRRQAGGPEVVLPDERLLELYRVMVLVRHLDERLLVLARQGRIHYAVGATGQEASVIGSAAALEKDDWLFPTLRESGAALLRGWPVERLLARAFGNRRDVALGREIPWVFYDRSVSQVSASPRPATQLPHAVGVAYAMRLRRDPHVTLAYLGDGATSASDFHAALNFAGSWKVPVVFVCQNNGWAVSTPVAKQTAAATLAVKARAYGLPGIRVDGNDLLAVHHMTKEAVDRARRGEGPTLLECVTYRVEGFMSNDDPSRYRSGEEVARWRARDPIERVKRYLVSLGLWSGEKEQAQEKAIRAELYQAVKKCESTERPPVESLFTDVTKQPTPQLEEQKTHFLAERRLRGDGPGRSGTPASVPDPAR